MGPGLARGGLRKGHACHLKPEHDSACYTGQEQQPCRHYHDYEWPASVPPGAENCRRKQQRQGRCRDQSGESEDDVETVLG